MLQAFSNAGQFLSKHFHWLSSQYWVWWAFFKSRTRQLLSRLWGIFVYYSVLLFLVSAVLTFLASTQDKVLSPETLSALDTAISMMFSWIGLLGAVAMFSLVFISLFVLSLYPKGRRIADKTFKFSESTELERFRNQVEDALTSINKRLDNIETKTNEGLKAIEATTNGRLKNIEITLKSLVEDKKKKKEKD